ncbi:MAG: acyl-phosphate glycerol 3-phosphate acyltransferase [Acidobacteria bacterium]|nr:MAG: acyl-phosphate glycerol 3-phosphate acyltransferase [Acidobacteriota bacterium]
MLEVSVTTLLIPLSAYVLGSIPFGLILAKLFGGTDVRKGGSGNIGATNVARVVGPVAGILTLILDVAKGSAAVLLAAELSQVSATWMMIAALAALVGHCFPVWLKFKGGKGVATAAGMFLVLCPLAFLGSVILFVLVVTFWRYVSLGSISAAAAMPLLMYFLWAPRHAPPLVITFGSLAAALLIVFKHAGNIRRLVQGMEPKFSFGKTKDTE